MKGKHEHSFWQKGNGDVVPNPAGPLDRRRTRVATSAAMYSTITATDRQCACQLGALTKFLPAHREARHEAAAES
jgi:hypothetical protein